MNKLPIAIALSAFGLTIAVVNAQACGESMFHSGQAMRYHAFITRQPADILIYRPEATDAASTEKQLYAGLQKAGHKVTVVTRVSSLTQALASKQFDVVIAGVRDMDTVTAELGKSSREPALVAVLDPGMDKDRGVHERFPRSVREGDGLNQYLKSIEKTMQTRGT